MKGNRNFLVRDLAILLLTVVMWVFLPAGDFGQIVTGGLTALCALLFHEHGHLLGARRAEASVEAAPIWSPFIFNLDPAKNTRAQLLSTSYWALRLPAFMCVCLSLFYQRITWRDLSA